MPPQCRLLKPVRLEPDHNPESLAPAYLPDAQKSPWHFDLLHAFRYRMGSKKTCLGAALRREAPIHAPFGVHGIAG
jgi:hypothetical protein